MEIEDRDQKKRIPIARIVVNSLVIGLVASILATIFFGFFLTSRPIGGGAAGLGVAYIIVIFIFYGLRYIFTGVFAVCFSIGLVYSLLTNSPVEKTESG